MARKKQAPTEPRPPKVVGTSIMDLCGVGRAYAPERPVTVAGMKRAVLEEAAESSRGPAPVRLQNRK